MKTIRTNTSYYSSTSEFRRQPAAAPTEGTLISSAATHRLRPSDVMLTRRLPPIQITSAREQFMTVNGLLRMDDLDTYITDLVDGDIHGRQRLVAIADYVRRPSNPCQLKRSRELAFC